MYIWKINSLKEQITRDELTEKDRFIYCLIYVSLCALGIELMARLPIENANIWDTISSLGLVLITILGTVFAYKANGAGSGNDFLGKYFSIGFVVTIRSLFLLIPIILVLAIYYYYSFAEDEEIYSTAIDVMPFLIWAIFIYWRICRHIYDVKNS